MTEQSVGEQTRKPPSESGSSVGGALIAGADVSSCSTKTMKVGLVIPDGAMGGAQRIALELLSEIPRRDVVVCAPRDSQFGREVLASGHQLRDLSLPKFADERSVFGFLKSYMRAVRTLFEVARKDQVTLLHSFVAFGAKVVAPVALLTRTPALLSVHEITTPSSIGSWRSRFHRWVSAIVFIRVTAVSQFAAECLVSMGFDRDRVTVVHNGVVRGVPSIGKTSCRSALGIPHEALVFAVVGRVERLKGQTVPTSAFAEFCHANLGVDAHLLIVGGAVQSHGRRYAARIAQEVDSTGLRERVHIYGHRDDVETFYDAADVVLVPSVEADAFPTVVLEAALSGVPAIVSNVGGAPEALVDGVTGFVVEPTSECFALAMSKAADPNWREAAGLAARRHVEKRFSRKEFVERIIEEWCRCTGPGAPPECTAGS